MKKNLTLSIPKPCSEKWESFTPTSDGGFCTSCSKVVVDFTKMSDNEIVDFFSNKPQHTCARLRPDQLKSYSYNTRPLHIVRPGYTLLKAGVLSLLFLFVNKTGSANPVNPDPGFSIATELQPVIKMGEVMPDFTIKGVVLSDEDGQPLPGVNILIKGRDPGYVTDANGQFEIAFVKPGDVLVFSFIGLRGMEYTVSGPPAGRIEIRMEQDVVGLLGAVADTEVYQENHSFLHTWWQKIKGIFS